MGQRMLPGSNLSHQKNTMYRLRNYHYIPLSPTFYYQILLKYAHISPTMGQRMLSGSNLPHQKNTKHRFPNHHYYFPPSPISYYQILPRYVYISPTTLWNLWLSPRFLNLQYLLYPYQYYFLIYQ